MKVTEHLFYGGIVTAALYPAFGPKALFFYVGNILIDSDHYIDYLYYSRFRNWSVKDMFRFHGTLAKWKDRKDILALEAFHTAEFLLTFLAVAYFFNSKELYLAFAGMIFHLSQDLYRLNQWGRIDIRALSFIEYGIRSRRMIHRTGVHPESVFEQAYRAISKAPEPLAREA